MQSGEIPDENIQASGFANNRPASYARLNGDKVWLERGTENKPWIQADIGYQTNVSGVITQGDGSQTDSTPDWVTQLSVSTFKNNTDDEEVYVKDNNGNDMVSVRNCVV